MASSNGSWNDSWRRGLRASLTHDGLVGFRVLCTEYSRCLAVPRQGEILDAQYPGIMEKEFLYTQLSIESCQNT